MKEILFRGKHAWGNCWVYGSLIQATNFCCILDPDDEGDMNYPYLDGDLGAIDGYTTPVKPETIGQFTCILDKNGKRIFEGDILKCDWGFANGEYTLLTVAFEDGVYICKPLRAVSQVRYLLYTESETTEVIGNIHDNPELLGEDNVPR